MSLNWWVKFFNQLKIVCTELIFIKHNRGDVVDPTSLPEKCTSTQLNFGKPLITVQTLSELI